MSWYLDIKAEKEAMEQYQHGQPTEYSPQVRLILVTYMKRMPKSVQCRMNHTVLQMYDAGANPKAIEKLLSEMHLAELVQQNSLHSRV